MTLQASICTEAHPVASFPPSDPGWTCQQPSAGPCPPQPWPLLPHPAQVSTLAQPGAHTHSSETIAKLADADILGFSQLPDHVDVGLTVPPVLSILSSICCPTRLCSLQGAPSFDARGYEGAVKHMHATYAPRCPLASFPALRLSPAFLAAPAVATCRHAGWSASLKRHSQA